MVKPGQTLCYLKVILSRFNLRVDEPVPHDNNSIFTRRVEMTDTVVGIFLRRTLRNLLERKGPIRHRLWAAEPFARLLTPRYPVTGLTPFTQCN